MTAPSSETANAPPTFVRPGTSVARFRFTDVDGGSPRVTRTPAAPPAGGTPLPVAMFRAWLAMYAASAVMSNAVTPEVPPVFTTRSGSASKVGVAFARSNRQTIGVSGFGHGPVPGGRGG